MIIAPIHKGDQSQTNGGTFAFHKPVSVCFFMPSSEAAGATAETLLSGKALASPGVNEFNQYRKTDYKNNAGKDSEAPVNKARNRCGEQYEYYGYPGQPQELIAPRAVVERVFDTQEQTHDC